MYGEWPSASSLSLSLATACGPVMCARRPPIASWRRDWETEEQQVGRRGGKSDARGCGDFVLRRERGRTFGRIFVGKRGFSHAYAVDSKTLNFPLLFLFFFFVGFFFREKK